MQDDLNQTKKGIAQYYKKKLDHLSEEQWIIINYVYNLLLIESFAAKNPKTVFIDGCAGSGKTEVAKILCEYSLKRFGKKTGPYISNNAIYASSYGVSALNYAYGNTAHSLFGYPLDIKDDVSYWNLEKGKWKSNQLLDSSLIVYDDISSVDIRYFHMLDRSLRRLMHSDELFGGKIILFVGDFRQLPPVLEGAEIQDKNLITCLSSLRSNIWDNLKTFSLTVNKRTEKNPQFAEFLRKLGMGQVEGTKIEDISDITYIPLQNISFTTSLKDIIEFVFPGDKLRNPDAAADRAILVPRNREAKNNNDVIIDQYLEGEVKSYDAIDSSETITFLQHNLTVLDTLSEDKDFPDYNLRLKKGALCMMMRKPQQDSKIINGTKVIVEDLSNDTIMVRKPGKSGKTSTTYEIKRIKFETNIYINGRIIKLTRMQFPLKVCYAITIHKGQGQTFMKAAVDLRIPSYFRTSIFRHGQLYLALSRVRYLKDVKVLVDEEHITNQVAYSHNLVYPELVSRYGEDANDQDVSMDDSIPSTSSAAI